MAKKKISKKAQKFVSEKISKISRDDPEKTPAQRAGKAFGIARQKGFKIPKPKRKRA